jgi:hypothetical protein
MTLMSRSGGGGTQERVGQDVSARENASLAVDRDKVATLIQPKMWMYL